MVNKRDDLQCLRALAIISVLGFHLWPNSVPYGYLGVDIFFVLSGYLMTLILSKNNNIWEFYGSRIKRIIPSYILVITLFTVVGYFVLLSSYFEFLKIEAIWSLLMINNLYPIFHQKQYFEMISEYKFFLHTWSLGVEIQFYFLAPFLIKFILSKNHSVLNTVVLASISMLSQISIKNNAITFGLVLCRIWQFLIGTLAFCLTPNEYEFLDENHVPKNNWSSTGMFIFLAIICFMPSILPEFITVTAIFRFISCGLTGLFIIRSASNPICIPKFANIFLVYIGNASYILYLVHWPLIIFFRYFQIIFYGPCVTLFCIVALSIFIHECFEKPISKLSLSHSLYFVTFCLAIFIFVMSMNIIFPKSNISAKVDPIIENENEAIACQSLYYKSCEKNLLIDKYFTARPVSDATELYCSYKLNPNATKTIMIIGNSYVYFQIKGILDAIMQAKMQFSEAFVVAYPTCSIILGNLNQKYEQCKQIDGSHDALLAVLKPDVIIHTGRIESYVAAGNNDTSIKYSYEEIEKAILHITNFTHRFIMIEPHPHFGRINYTNPHMIAHALQINQNLADFKISSKEHHKYHDPSNNLVKQAASICKKCIYLPTEKLFCGNEHCYIVNLQTKISRYCDTAHITPNQSMVLTNSLIDAIDKVLI